MKKNLLFLFSIFLIAFVIRVFDISDIPSGLHRDEAFLGYNAYSLLKTGRDMNGVLFPLHLKSFLYTPAGYSYLSIIPVALFGLNEFSVRLPSAFFGALSIFPLYFFVSSAFRKSKNSERVAHASCVFLAVTPWHIILSRTASVITVVTFFILCGVIFAMLWQEKQKILFLILSFVMFVVSLMFYISPFSLLPLFVPALFIYLGIFKKNKKTVLLVTTLIFIVILVPLIMTLSSTELSLRARSLSIANHELAKLVTEEQIREDGVSDIPIKITRLFHNKPLNLLHEFSWNFVRHISPEFLLTDNYFPDRYRIPFTGLLFLWQLPLFLIGVFRVVKDKMSFGYFCLFWIAVSPIGSSLTFDDVPNIQRVLFMLPPILIICALGFDFLFNSVKYKKFFILSSLGLISISFMYFAHQYLTHGKLYRPWYRQDGYKELVQKVKKQEEDYKRIVITNRESAPTIFFLFYTGYDPRKFWQDTKTPNTQDFDRVNFSKYEFSQEECPLKFDNVKKKLVGQKGVLYVNSSLCKESKDIKTLEKIYRSDNSEVFSIVRL